MGVKYKQIFGYSQHSRVIADERKDDAKYRSDLGYIERNGNVCNGTSGLRGLYYRTEKQAYDQNEYDDRFMVYYVGDKSKNRSYPNACCMRKVISMRDSLEYEEILTLMAVEFVRNSQYTVLLFPFMYLREYMKQS